MGQTAINYAKTLYRISVAEEEVESCKEIFSKVPQLKKILRDPTVSLSKKYQLVQRIFPKGMWNFLKIVVKYKKIEEIEEIFERYYEYTCEQKGILNAKLYYVSKPEETVLAKLKQKLSSLYGRSKVVLTLVESPQLIGGFVIRTGCREIDQSFKGRLKQLEQKLIRR